MEFIDLDDPRIKISNELKNRFQDIEGELLLSSITKNNICNTEDIWSCPYFTGH